jgi:hypothetical protein
MVIADKNNYNIKIYSHKRENRHSKNTKEEMNVKHLKPDLKSKIQEELEKSHKEQLILFKQNKQTIIDFIIDNKDSIKIEDLKSYEPIYNCYREKGNCNTCNILTNIICKNCNYKEVWLCTNHWQQHRIDNHE